MEVSNLEPPGASAPTVQPAQEQQVAGQLNSDRSRDAKKKKDQEQDDNEEQDDSDEGESSNVNVSISPKVYQSLLAFALFCDLITLVLVFFFGLGVLVDWVLSLIFWALYGYFILIPKYKKDRSWLSILIKFTFGGGLEAIPVVGQVFPGKTGVIVYEYITNNTSYGELVSEVTEGGEKE